MTSPSGPQRIRELFRQPGIIRSLGAHDVNQLLGVDRFLQLRRDLES